MPPIQGLSRIGWGSCISRHPYDRRSHSIFSWYYDST